MKYKKRILSLGVMAIMAAMTAAMIIGVGASYPISSSDYLMWISVMLYALSLAAFITIFVTQIVSTLQMHRIRKQITEIYEEILSELEEVETDGEIDKET